MTGVQTCALPISNFVSTPMFTVDEEHNPVANYFSNGGTNKVRIDYFFTKITEPNDVQVVAAPLSDHYGITLYV